MVSVNRKLDRITKLNHNVFSTSVEHCSALVVVFAAKNPLNMGQIKFSFSVLKSQVLLMLQ